VFWVISVYFNIRNTLPKSATFLLGHPVYSKEKIQKQKSAYELVDNNQIEKTPFSQQNLKRLKRYRL
jgi:hypothetical protein